MCSLGTQIRVDECHIFRFPPDPTTPNVQQQHQNDQLVDILLFSKNPFVSRLVSIHFGTILKSKVSWSVYRGPRLRSWALIQMEAGKGSYLFIRTIKPYYSQNTNSFNLCVRGILKSISTNWIQNIAEKKTCVGNGTKVIRSVSTISLSSSRTRLAVSPRWVTYPASKQTSKLIDNHDQVEPWCSTGRGMLEDKCKLVSKAEEQNKHLPTILQILVLLGFLQCARYRLLQPICPSQILIGSKNTTQQSLSKSVWVEASFPKPSFEQLGLMQRLWESFTVNDLVAFAKYLTLREMGSSWGQESFWTRPRDLLGISNLSCTAKLERTGREFRGCSSLPA